MAKQRVTQTDQLSNVIDVAQLGRRTGLLSVERDDPYHEEGEVYFLAGRPIYAALGPYRGRDALAELTFWGQCRFSFDTDVPPPTPNVSDPQRAPSDPRSGVSRPNGSSPSMAGSGWGTSGASPNGASSWANGRGIGARSGVWNAPVPGQPQPPQSPQPPQPAQPPQQPIPPYNGNGGNGNGAYGAYGPSSSYGASGSMGGVSGYGQSAPSGYPNGAQSPRLMQKPRRAPDVRDLMTVVTKYNLSRTHRTLLLLADGDHSILDLARISSKPVDEVLQLLGELERYGLVYYYG